MSKTYLRTSKKLRVLNDGSSHYKSDNGCKNNLSLYSKDLSALWARRLVLEEEEKEEKEERAEEEKKEKKERGIQKQNPPCPEGPSQIKNKNLKMSFLDRLFTCLLVFIILFGALIVGFLIYLSTLEIPKEKEGYVYYRKGKRMAYDPKTKKHTEVPKKND